MKVELLHIVDCPNTAVAEEHARAALDALGLADVPVELVTIRTEAEAADAPFGGSPSILVDGVDLFPTAPVRSLACRVYATGSGYAGAPTQEQIEAALRGASR
ncbi:hypothetical protein FB468_2795 [Leucobacter komagatae]|jgi:hypothetical protein|uniref:Thioredoxin family protein n=1 Tax=Leucobacter komagatae TaxID=55969 RepID=A0A542Y9J4_9MICO|nr:hypothetical protein [Leucobacter komagatae]TQL44727.1 hypothetical protein FB468_2795 [Leucobacter komagatae]